jgi:hypothetical protein
VNLKGSPHDRALSPISAWAGIDPVAELDERVRVALALGARLLEHLESRLADPSDRKRDRPGPRVDVRVVDGRLVVNGVRVEREP